MLTLTTNDLVDSKVLLLLNKFPISWPNRFLVPPSGIELYFRKKRLQSQFRFKQIEIS